MVTVTYKTKNLKLQKLKNVSYFHNILMFRITFCLWNLSIKSKRQTEKDEKIQNADSLQKKAINATTYLRKIQS